MMSVNQLVLPGSYTRKDANWTCCECCESRYEYDMSLVLPTGGKWWFFEYDEPDWVCVDCLEEKAVKSCTWTKYCKACWHVMDFDLDAQFHSDYEICPLSGRKDPQR